MHLEADELGGIWRLTRDAGKPGPLLVVSGHFCIVSSCDLSRQPKVPNSAKVEAASLLKAGPELAQSHIHSILMIKASHSTSPESLLEGTLGPSWKPAATVYK